MTGAPMRGPADPLVVEVVDYDHPDVVLLVAAVQAEYVARYGGRDQTPLAAAELSPPGGVFLLGRAAGRPVAMGGWRTLGEPRACGLPGERPAELKRMYVAPDARGRGYARRVLLDLERTARHAGRDWMVLETGLAQPEAIALYRSAGYTDVPAFGYYCASDLSVHLGRRLVPDDEV